MKKTVKKVISSVLVAAMLLSFVPMSGVEDLTFDFTVKSSAKETSGKCGDNVFYTLDEETGVLTISGSGDMEDFPNYYYAPFSRKTIIKKVIIENDVTSIGDWCFYECTNLSSVVIANSVTKIGYCAFSDCSSLTKIEISDKITSIGASAFADCEKLTGIFVDENNSVYSSDDNGVLFNKERTKLIQYPEGNNQTTYSIPGSVNIIFDFAFSGCKNLKDIMIPDSVTTIGYAGFYSCIGLKAITIPNSVTTIGEYAFRECVILSSITIPSSVISIGESAFYMCRSLYNVYYNGTASEWCNIKRLDSLSSPNSYAEKLYFQGELLTEIVLNDDVEEVPDYAFKGCVNLTKVTIPNDVTRIGNYAFFNCTKLTDVIIPEGVTGINNSTFDGCKNLASIKIPDNVTNIGSYAFRSCTSLKKLNIPDGVVTIGDGAFVSCTSIISMIIPNSVTNIGKSVFSGCTSLTNIKIGSGVTSIGTKMFSGCLLLISIIVDSENKTFDSRENCNAIVETATNTLITGCKNTVIPNSVTSIKESAFTNTGIIDITIPNSVMKIGKSAFSDCGLISIKLSDNITSIERYSFGRCYHLTSITIPDKVTSIGPQAFYYCESLKSIVIPNEVTSVSSDAFNKCSSLNSVCFISKDVTIEYGAFPKNDNMQVLAPKDSSVYNALKGDYNVIPYSFTVNKDDKDKPMLALDGKVVLTEDMWSCICRLVKDTDVQYIYFGELDVSKMLSSDVLENVDESSLKSEKVTLSIIRDGETIRLGNIEEKTSFQKIVEAVTEFFTFVLNSVYKGIKGVWASIKNWWKR